MSRIKLRTKISQNDINPEEVAIQEATISDKNKIMVVKTYSGDIIKFAPATLDGDDNYTVLTSASTKSLIAEALAGDGTGSFVTVSTDQTITGTKSFTSYPLLPSISPTLDAQATRKKYVDDSILALINDSTTSSTSAWSSSKIESYLLGELDPATETTIGGVIVGFGLNVDSTGMLSVDSTALDQVSYTLHPATAGTLGGVKVGTGLSITGAGLLSVDDSQFSPVGHIHSEFSDHTNFLTITDAASTYATITHLHTGVYSPTGHTHPTGNPGTLEFYEDAAFVADNGGLNFGPGFSLADSTGYMTVTLDPHNHDGTYSPVGHDHVGTYAPISHYHVEFSDHTNFLTITDAATTYSVIGHNHSGTYAPLSHTHIEFSDHTSFITLSDAQDEVTFGNLNINGGVGTGSSQVAVGDHMHPVYDLPVATDSDLGGVIVGTGLTIDGTGMLSTSGGPLVKMFQGIDTTGDLAVTNSLQVIPLDSVSIKDDHYGHSTTVNPGEVTILEAGWYKISAMMTVSTRSATGGVRGNPQLHIQIDTGSGFVTQPDEMGGYIRENDTDRLSCSITGIGFFYFEGGDKMRLVVHDSVADEPDEATEPYSQRLLIEYIDRTGAASGVVNNLKDIGDVSADAPNDGDILSFDGTNSVWVAQNPTTPYHKQTSAYEGGVTYTSRAGSLETKATLSLPGMTAGVYRVSWSAEYTVDDENDKALIYVYVNDGTNDTDISDLEMAVKKKNDPVAAVGTWYSAGGFKYITAPADSDDYNIYFQLGSTDAADTAGARRIRIEIWRVS